MYALTKDTTLVEMQGKLEEQFKDIKIKTVILTDHAKFIQKVF